MTNNKQTAAARVAHSRLSPRVAATQDHDHAAHAGAHCTNDGTGCCRDCGVALVDCEVCGGIGYHTELCTEG